MWPDDGTIAIYIILGSVLNWIVFYLVIKAAVKKGTKQAMIEVQAPPIWDKTDAKMVEIYHEMHDED